MKKLICAVCSLFLLFPVFAVEYDTHQVFISAAAFEDALAKYVSPDYQVGAAQVFLKKRNPQTGKIAISDMLSVCVAGNITYCLQHPEDKMCKDDIYSVASHENDTCDDFVEYALSRSRGAVNLDRAITTEALCKEWNGTWVAAQTGGYKCIGADGYILVYSYSCKSKKGQCVSDFKELKTQTPIAKQFIYMYGNQKSNQFTCMHDHVKRGAKYYVQCTSAGQAYEFEFSDLNKNPNQKTIESENKMLCEFFGGKELPARDETDKKFSFRCDISRDVCNDKVIPLARTIGHTADYTAGACTFGKDALKLNSTDLKHIDGVDSYRFIENQLRSEVAQRYVEEYLKIQIGAKNAKCGPEIYSLDDANTPLNQKYVLRCNADGREVDFVFEDLTEKIDFVVDASASRMACDMLGGQGTDRNCRGLEAAECTKLNDVLKSRGYVGTHYDVKLGGCILDDAQKAHDVDLGIQVAGGVALTVVSLGTATPATVVVLVGASVGTDLAFEAVDYWRRVIPYNDYQRFMSEVNECGDISSPDSLEVNRFCVMNVFSDFADVMVGDLPDLAPEVRANTMEKLMQMQELVGDENIVRKASGEKIANRTTQASLFALALLLNPDKLLAKMSGMSETIRLTYRASKNFGQHYDDFIKTGRMIGLPAGRMDAMEWRRLNTLLKPKGVELYETTMNGQRVMAFRRVRVGVDDTFLRMMGAELRESSTLGGKSYYRIYVDVDTDVDTVVNRLREDGFYVSSGKTEGGRYFLAASSEDIFGPWDTMGSNWLRNDDGVVRVVDVGIAGQNGANARGEALRIKLRSRYKNNREWGNFFEEKFGGSQCQSGLKFHASVVPEDLEQASYLVHDVAMRHSGVLSDWKVHVYGMTGDQLGKDFTMYVSKDGYDVDAIQSFLRDLEDTFRRHGIRSNGVGKNVVNGDNTIPGSRYLYYRYDMTNDNGIPDGVYNNSYQFIAPRPEYGGDIMDGVRIR